MKKVNWATARSAVVAYAIHGAIGAAIGAFYGFRGALREAHDTAIPLARLRPFDTTPVAAAVGFVAGLFFWRLGWMRERGGVYYFFSWGLSLGTAVALIALPTILRTGEWLAYGVAVAVGVIGGCGLGALILLIVIKESEKDDKSGK